MRKLIIIPAYNESANIEKTIADIQKNAPDYDYIVVNDCSKDNTLEILTDNGFLHLDLDVNLGIGGAVQAGYRYAFENAYEIAVQVDGDGQHDVKYLDRMLEAMLREEADMVIGSRYIEKKGFQSTKLRRIGITYFTGMIRILTGKVITDPTSGFRMINRRTIELFSTDYPRDYPEPESVVNLLKKKMKILEVPVIMRERMGGISSIRMTKSVYYMLKVSLAILIEWIR